ncbi:MAG: DNA repair exonuclease [Dehalococcoidia bacterium]|jgi:DNA repair exonuclease SbcCD nuclease subunit|nr:DNA repair exonuclease [Dehalococcoidia bacterium]
MNSSDTGAGSGSKPPLRLLHTSDVHLGAYDHGRGDHLDGMRAGLEDAFRRTVDKAVNEQVDAMLIAGDFIDNARVRDETLHNAAAEIARTGVPVVVLPGNHDHVGPSSLYNRIDWAAEAPNLHLMREPGGETVAPDGLDVEIWGRSHTEQDPRFTPFADAPPRGEAAWQIGIGHGHFIHPGAALQHSFHIYEEELQAMDRDYVALGHWERLVRVAAGGTTAAYSGAPESLSGSVGGRVLLVDLQADGSVRIEASSLDGEAPVWHDDIPFLEGAEADPRR